MTEKASDLINIVAHDLKSPIGAVRGYVELLRSVGPLNERQEMYADRVEMALDYMQFMIENLLNFSRMESGLPLELKELDLCPVIQECVHLLEGLAARRGIRIELHTPETPVMVTGDARLLTQAMVNLVSNATKYNRDGGTIVVRVRQERKHAFVSVQDTGIGIAPEDQTRVFERFFRAHTGKRIEGSGLGLAITRMIVQRHQGSIWLESTPDVGTTFFLSLPQYLKGSEERRPTDAPTMHSEEVLDKPRRRRRRKHDEEESSEESDAVDDAIQEARHRPTHKQDARDDEV